MLVCTEIVEILILFSGKFRNVILVPFDLNVDLVLFT